MTPIRPIGRIEAFVVSYVAAVAAVTAALDAMSVAHLILNAGGWKDMAMIIPTIILATLWFGMAACLFALPAVAIGHPVAILIAGRLRSRRRTVIVGILLGPPLGVAALQAAFTAFGDGPAPITWDSALMLIPTSSSAGAAMGWVAHRTVASRITGERP